MDASLPSSPANGSIPASRVVRLGLFLLAIALPAVAGPNGDGAIRPREGPVDCIGCLIWDVSGFIQSGCNPDFTPTPAPTHGTTAAPGVPRPPTPPPPSVGIRPGSAARAATIDPGLYLRLRDESFLETTAGRHFADLYDMHTREMSQIALTHPEAFDAATRVLSNWQTVFLPLLE